METITKIEPNKKQQEAIKQLDGTIMVLAGPGTGKTFTIIEKIKYMIASGISPEKILCMTFSDAASTEMKTRLEKEIGEKACELKISTYHAFCSEIIKNFSFKFNLKDNFEIIDEIKQYLIMCEVISEYKPIYNKSKLGEFMSNIKELVKKVGKIKKSLITKDEYYRIAQTGFAWQGEIDRFEEKKADAIAHNRGTKGVESDIEKIKNKILKAYEIWEIYELYNKKIHEKNLIDFDDMIAMVLEKFKEDKDFLNEIASNWDYIIVDEYQDTNIAQNNLIFALEQGRGLGNLFVVGDDDQLIYSFQGAQLDTLENFLNLYPNTNIICLNENNRSTQTILDYSYNVISQDDCRLENNPKFITKNISKKLTAKNKKIAEKSRKIQKHQFNSVIQENNFVVDEIIKILNSDEMPKNENEEPDLSQIAVLTSSNEELKSFAELLKNKGILFQIRDSKDIFEIKSVILTYFYLKVLENNKLYMDKLFGLLLYAPFNFNSDDYNFLISKAAINNEKDFITIIKENINHNWIDKNKVNNFLKTFNELKEEKNNRDLKEIILSVINKTGILSYYTSTPINRYDNIMGLKKLLEVAENFSKFKNTYSITDFVKYLDISFNNDIKIKTEEDIFTKNAIQLTTIHSSKGREYSYVFMVNLISSKWEGFINGCSDDFSLPIKDYPNKYADLKELRSYLKKTEQLKKLFVGITRAKYGLYLTFSDRNEKQTQTLTKYLSSLDNPNLIEYHYHEMDSEKNIIEISKTMTQENLSKSLKLRNQIELRMEDFILSATSMNSYLNCPKDFLLNYVFKIPVKDSDTSVLEYGNTIHAVMESIYKNNSTYPSIREIKELFKNELNKRPFKAQGIRESYEQRGLENLEKYYPTLILTPIDKVIETEMDITADFENWKIKGKIDRVDLNDDGTYTIYDYKTGNGEGKNSKIKPGGENENYYNQLRFYKLLYELNYPDRIVSKSAIIYPETQTIIEKEFTSDEMEDIKEKIRFVYKSIQDLYFENNDKSATNCAYCKYKQMCNLG